MSLDASMWAWKQKCGKSSSKLVLLSLADRAGADHCAYPSIETLSNDTELNSKTIRSAIKHLIETGLIQDTNLRKGPTQQVKVYQLIGVIGRHETLPKTAGFKDTQKRQGSKIGSLPKTDLKTTDIGLEDTQNWVAEPIKNLSRTNTNNINREKGEIHPVLEKAKLSDLNDSRQLQNSDTHLAMSNDWQPNEITIQRISSLAVPVNFIQNEIPNFRVFWITENRPPKANTWDAAFLRHIQFAWRKHQNQQGANSNAANQQQRSTSGRYQQPGQFSIDHDDLSWFHEMQSEQSPFDAPASDGAGCESGELRPLTDHNDFPEMARALPNSAGSEFGQKGLDANFGGAGRDE